MRERLTEKTASELAEEQAQVATVEEKEACNDKAAAEPEKDAACGDKEASVDLDKVAAGIKKAHNQAVRCLVASQRMLPGADQDMHVAMATDFMKLAQPELIERILERQAAFAGMLRAAAEEKAAELVPEDEAITVEANAEQGLPSPATQEEEKEAAAPVEEEKEAAAPVEEEKEAAAPVEEEKEAAAPVEEEKEAAAPAEEEKEAAAPVEEEKEAAAPAEEEKEAAAPAEEEKVAFLEAKVASLEAKLAELLDPEKKEDLEEEGEDEDKKKTASAESPSLMDDIFASVIPQSQPKLSGLISTKTASKHDLLDNLFEGAPDVSYVFGRKR